MILDETTADEVDSDQFNVVISGLLDQDYMYSTDVTSDFNRVLSSIGVEMRSGYAFSSILRLGVENHIVLKTLGPRVNQPVFLDLKHVNYELFLLLP